jgi:hypothetical protein
MKTIDGFQDLKPPADYSDGWKLDLYEPEPADRRLWFLVIGALQMLVGLCLGFWLGVGA